MKQLNSVLAIALLLFFLTINTTMANHIVGMEIRYKSVGTRLYEVSLKMYRECSGIQMCSACVG
jgi:hypothetical protein